MLLCALFSRSQYPLRTIATPICKGQDKSTDDTERNSMEHILRATGMAMSGNVPFFCLYPLILLHLLLLPGVVACGCSTRAPVGSQRLSCGLITTTWLLGHCRKTVRGYSGRVGSFSLCCFQLKMAVAKANADMFLRF